jgi:hypothetical protein
MAGTFYSSAYVAAYLGTSPTSVHNWLGEEDFPQPESVHLGLGGTVTTRGWSSEQLADLRTWRTRRLGLDEDDATRHWLSVDEALREGRRIKRDHVTKGQLTFDMERVRAA